MKKIYLLSILCLGIVTANAQQVSCRPKTCVVDYYYHNDLVNTSHRDSLIDILPDLLITCTPGSFWGGRNGHTGAIPSFYTAHNIEVFSYIAGGYEDSLYRDDTDTLSSNLMRIDSISDDGATGVFLDEVSSYPDVASKAYIMAIRTRCTAKGLKLILNPGVEIFDPWLMTQCDYIMTDENYNGTRALSDYEKPFADKVIVVSENVSTASGAAAISSGARAQGFGFSYACTKYIYLPVWANQYMTLITQPPATPVVTLTGTTLVSNQPYGNNWYTAASVFTGNTGKTFSPAATGSYYDIVKLQGCSSAASNTVTISVTAAQQLEVSKQARIFPIPAADIVNIEISGSYSASIRADIYTITGSLVKSATLSQHVSKIDIAELPEGNYIIAITGGITEQHKLTIQR